MVVPSDPHADRADDALKAPPAPASPPPVPQCGPAAAPGDDAVGNDNVDPILAALLQAFWDTRQEAPGKRLSLARLSKRAALPMSTLRRTLAQLEDAGLVTVAIDEDGAGSVVPAPELLGLIEDLLG